MAVEKNMLKAILEVEKITQEALADASKLNLRTIGKACNHVRISSSAKRKLVDGLNKIAKKGPYSVGGENAIFLKFKFTRG